MTDAAFLQIDVGVASPLVLELLRLRLQPALYALNRILAQPLCSTHRTTETQGAQPGQRRRMRPSCFVTNAGAARSFDRSGPEFRAQRRPLELYSNPRALKCSPDPLVSLQERGSRMVQLLSVLNAAILALCGVLGSAILLAFNSSLRSQAEGHPGSWLYWHVKWCDYLLTHTVLRPAF